MIVDIENLNKIIHDLVKTAKDAPLNTNAVKTVVGEIDGLQVVVEVIKNPDKQLEFVAEDKTCIFVSQ